jgi:hypothetical protein
MTRKLWAAIAAVVVCIPGVSAGSVVEAADPPACHVRNVTRDTAGRTLRGMTRAAQDGDRLWVRGTCVGGVVIGKDLVIAGRGDHAVVTGLEQYRVFRIRAGATVVMRHLTISHGVGWHDGTRGGGGGVYNDGTVTLVDVVVSRAQAGEDPGGAITNIGTMTVLDSIIRSSRADWGGGIGNRGILTVTGSRVVSNVPEGIWSLGGLVTISDSVVRDNAWGGLYLGGKGDATIDGSRVTGNRRGGGITKSGGGTLTLEASVISGNTSSQDGGGIAAHWGRLVLNGTTVTGNAARRHGGGIFVEDGTTTVTLDATSSVTGNVPDDCYGTPAC